MKYPVPKELDCHLLPHLPKWDSLADEFKQGTAPECKAAQMLFFNGGKLSDFGYKVKDSLDYARVIPALQATLMSHSVKHEHKIAGVGALIRDWCDEV